MVKLVHSSISLLLPIFCVYGQIEYNRSQHKTLGIPLVIFHHCRNCWFTLTSSNHLSIPGHSPLQHNSLVSLGFWWVTLLIVSWKVTWVISDGSFLCISVNPFKELSKCRSLKADCVHSFFVLFFFLWSLLIYLVQTPDFILTWNLFMFVTVIGGCIVLLVIKLFN